MTKGSRASVTDQKGLIPKAGIIKSPRTLKIREILGQSEFAFRISACDKKAVNLIAAIGSSKDNGNVSEKIIHGCDRRITCSFKRLPSLPQSCFSGFEGKIKTVTISKSSTGKYYASVLVDNGIELPKTKEVIRSTTIGIDVGISNFVVTSEGEVFPNLRSLKSCLDRLKVIQKRASRKVKGSQNKKKANKRVAMLHEKIRNKRIDHIHKTTSALVKTKIHESQVESIVVEDLNVAGMLKNRKLSQALSDVSLSEFMRQLDYKCKWNGINLIKIGRFDPSSKLCSSCQQKNDNLKLSDRLWTCSNCGETHDRDLNAAINVRDIGLSRSGRSEEPVELSALVEAVKQESNSVIVCNVVN